MPYIRYGISFRLVLSACMLSSFLLSSSLSSLFLFLLPVSTSFISTPQRCSWLAYCLCSGPGSCTLVSMFVYWFSFPLSLFCSYMWLTSDSICLHSVCIHIYIYMISVCFIAAIIFLLYSIIFPSLFYWIIYPPLRFLYIVFRCLRNDIVVLVYLSRVCVFSHLTVSLSCVCSLLVLYGYLLLIFLLSS